jgi:hypothetical protein
MDKLPRIRISGCEIHLASDRWSIVLRIARWPDCPREKLGRDVTLPGLIVRTSFKPVRPISLVLVSCPSTSTQSVEFTENPCFLGHFAMQSGLLRVLR